MKKSFTLLIALLLAVTVAGCAPAQPGIADATAPSGGAASTQTATAVAAVCTSEQPNFLLLISDEANDIGDFSELWVTISGVGFVLGDEEGVYEQLFDESDWVDVNLVGLTGEAAVAIWSGYVPEGDYTKIFLYVEEVWGLPLEAEEDEAFEIKLPSSKLQIQLPVEVEGEEPTDFVFDISVHKAGNSGQYILKPQLSESGQGALYQIETQAQEQTRHGKPEWAGKPHESGKPTSAGKPDTEGTGLSMEASDDAGKPADGGGREEKGKPEWAGTPGGKDDDTSSDDLD